jgi:hypothetical protein
LDRGKNSGWGETNASFLVGPYLNPGRGTPVGWAAFPVGVGLTEQGLMWDPLGHHWQFCHIYRGVPHRHLLTTDWRKLLNAKLLVTGDTIVFMRRPVGRLLVDLRRAPGTPSTAPRRPTTHRTQTQAKAAEVTR